MRTVWGGLVALGLAASAVFASAWIARDLPDLRRLEVYRPPLGSVVLDRRGRPIGEFFDERRRLVSLGRVPRHVVQAFLASEDVGFFEHRGLDLASIARAAWVNLRAGGRIVQGGSTITQQLAKTLFLSPERTVARKLQDMLLALRIERRFSKQEILEFYLNQIYFGSGAYGVAQAAESYFSKDVSALSLSEAALLAGLPKAPSALSPRGDPEAAENRRRYVLEQMHELGHIDAASLRAALEERPELAAQDPPEAYDLAAYFVEEVRQALFAALGAEAVLRGGLRVETTLDLELQREAVRAVRDGLEALARRRGASAARPPDVEGALVALDVATGGVLALVGGYDFSRSRFDRATQALRQPGSAFKTFVYGAALEAGFTPDSTVFDYRVEYPDPQRGGPWRPRNYDGRERGPVPISEAFARSLNNATVRLLDDVGVKRVRDFARRAGIRSPLAGDLGLALGTSEVTLLEITSAYGTFATGGRPLRPRFVLRVLDRDGRVLREDLAVAGAGEDAPGISPVDAYLVTHLLREAVRAWYGTGHAAADLGHPLAGKTGSTNGNRDAWFIGFSPEVAAGVWVGHDAMESLGPRESGARAALPIWNEFMQAVLAARPAREFPRPEGVRFADVDPETGERRESRLAYPGWVPLAAGRRVRQSTFVRPPEPLEPVEPPEPRFFVPVDLPAVADAPPDVEPRGTDPLRR